MAKELKPCHFCGGKTSLAVNDAEGNLRDKEYERDPWSGLSYTIQHLEEDYNDCPIANFDGESVGTLLYDSREEAIKTWNKRF